jgi:hypothetical protein
MKKILILTIILFNSIISYSQSSFQRGYEMSVGLREEVTDTVVWIIENKETDVLIAYDTDKITIFSGKTQIYRNIKPLLSNEQTSTWLMVDNDGGKCHVEFGIYSEKKIMYLKIEYIDTIIIYLTKPN